MTSTSLAERLKIGTQSLHREVERSGLMPEFLRGRITCRAYCLLLRNLHAIYAALEAALSRHANDPAIAEILRPELLRCAALEADLISLHGPGWAQELPLSQPAADYRDHLETLAEHAPPRLVAHAYVRYLGDLNGGQILRRIVRTAIELGEGPGTRFHEFPAPGVAVLAAEFRAGLDAIVLPEIELAAIVDEARLGFRLHGQLFEALGEPPLLTLL